MSVMKPFMRKRWRAITIPILTRRLNLLNVRAVTHLAVAIGNQHGVYTSEPQLNFEVVKRVRDAVSVPLVLHGASGISDADIKTAISLGIAKINIHTELCQAAMVAVKENRGSAFPAF